MAVIAADSSDIASSAHTDVLLLRFVRVFSQGAGSGSNEFSTLSFLVRKTAHVIEYGILGALLTRATRGMLPGYVRGRQLQLLWRAASVALPCGLVVSVADEIHQTTVPSRVGSPKDVAWDFLGLVLGLLATWLVWRRRRRGPSRV